MLSNLLPLFAGDITQNGDLELILILIITIAVIVAVIVYIFKCIEVVRQGTKKIVERFGVYRRTLGPGLHVLFKPFDRVVAIPFRMPRYTSYKLHDLYDKELDIDENGYIEEKKYFDSEFEQFVDILAKDSSIRDLFNKNRVKGKEKGVSQSSNKEDLETGLDLDIDAELDADVRSRYRAKEKEQGKQGAVDPYFIKASIKDVLNTAFKQKSKEQGKGKAGYEVDTELDLDVDLDSDTNFDDELFFRLLTRIKSKEALNDKLEELKKLSVQVNKHSRGSTTEKRPFPTLEEWLNQEPDWVYYIDMRERFDEDREQSVITKDNASIEVHSCLFYQVTDPFLFYYGSKDPELSVKLLAITTLRNTIGTLTLEECISSRVEINNKIRAALDEATGPWGIKVNRVEIKEIVLNDDVMKMMNQVVIAERQKRAEILLSEGQAQGIINRRAAEAQGYIMLKGADLDERILQIRGFEAINDLAQGQATKIYVPENLSSLITKVGLFGEAFGEGMNQANNNQPTNQTPKVDNPENPDNGNC